VERSSRRPSDGRLHGSKMLSGGTSQLWWTPVPHRRCPYEGLVQCPRPLARRPGQRSDHQGLPGAVKSSRGPAPGVSLYCRGRLRRGTFHGPTERRGGASRRRRTARSSGCPVRSGCWLDRMAPTSRGDDHRMNQSFDRWHHRFVRWQLFEPPRVLLIEVNGELGLKVRIPVEFEQSVADGVTVSCKAREVRLRPASRGLGARDGGSAPPNDGRVDRAPIIEALGGHLTIRARSIAPTRGVRVEGARLGQEVTKIDQATPIEWSWKDYSKPDADGHRKKPALAELRTAVRARSRKCVPAWCGKSPGWCMT
jgi:hypothetical protein